MRRKDQNNIAARAQILSKLRRRKAELERRYKISEIGIFGSFVRGEQRRPSDIDILVDFREAPDLLMFIEMENTLTNLLNRKVDLIDKRGLRPQLREAILGEVVYV